MLDSVECDAVAVVTPDFAHAGPIVAAAKRNKNGDVRKSIDKGQLRFHYSDNIKNIMKNSL